MVSGQVRFIVFTKNKERPKIQAMLPTSSNLSVHVSRAHASAGHAMESGRPASPIFINLSISATILAYTITEEGLSRVSRWIMLRRKVNALKMVLRILIICMMSGCR